MKDLQSTVEGISEQPGLVKDAALKLLQDDESFRAAVRRGLEQADRGEFIEEAEMDARIKRMRSEGPILSRGD